MARDPPADFDLVDPGRVCWVGDLERGAAGIQDGHPAAVGGGEGTQLGHPERVAIEGQGLVVLRGGHHEPELSNGGAHVISCTSRR